MTASNYVGIGCSLFRCISTDFDTITNFVLLPHLTEPAPYMEAGSFTYEDAFCQRRDSSCYYRMSSRVSLGIERIVSFIVVINDVKNGQRRIRGFRDTAGKPGTYQGLLGVGI